MFETLLPEPQVIQLEETTHRLNTIECVISLTQTTALCPRCHSPSCHIHSQYSRTLDDLSLAGTPLRLIWRIRRFLCDNTACPKRTFAERHNALARPYAHRTERQSQTLTRLARALGGSAGSRTAATLGLAASTDTLLRLIRRSVPPTPDTAPRHLGVDDFALRRGHHYGSILVDLDSHRPINMLPDRTSDTFATWLTNHPSAEIISRDRAGAYADGGRRGAPDALQVADRFHVVKNVGEMVERFLERKQIWKIAVPPLAAEPQSVNPPAVPPAVPPVAPTPKRPASYERRHYQYSQVHALLAQGLSLRAIAARLGIGRNTVAKYRHMATFPDIIYQPRRSCLDPYTDYLRERWNAGEHNSTRLWAELKQQGFRGSLDVVQRYVQGWRPRRTAGQRTAPQPPKPQPLVPRRVAYLLLMDSATYTPKQQHIVATLFSHDEQITRVTDAAQRFLTIVRERKAAQLGDWVVDGQQSHIRELVGFARGIDADYDAVRNALTLPYSNGVVEGINNRIKLVKRSMYGRAKLDLLRARVLAA